MAVFYFALQVLILYAMYVYSPIQFFYMMGGVFVVFLIIYIVIFLFDRDKELSAEDRFMMSLGVMSMIPSLIYKGCVFIIVAVIPLVIVSLVIYYSSFAFLWLFVPWVALFFGLAVIEDCGQRYEAGKKSYESYEDD